MEKTVERFLKYIEFDTSSDGNSANIPSTNGQLQLGRYLVKELEELGAEAKLSDSGIVYACVRSNSRKNDIPAIGFLAHMDTPPGLKATEIRPKFIHSYDGGRIVFDESLNLFMEPETCTFLKDLTGHELIVSDGTTILGADDKAGVAELVTLLDTLLHNPSIEHGDVYAAFTVDEEIGKGMEYFDTELFPCAFAYTVDIDANDIHCLNYETICSGRVEVSVRGKPVHPGSATGILRNASQMAMEFHGMLPQGLDPFYSSGYEGFNHLCEIEGKVDYALLKYRIGNFDRDGLWEQMRQFERIGSQLNEKYGYDAFSVTMKQVADNLKHYIGQDTRCLEKAKEAMKAVGLKGLHRPVRGGTDGVVLSKKGIPTPNLNNGSYNARGYFEVLSVDYMKKCVELLVEIARVK